MAFDRVLFPNRVKQLGRYVAGGQFNPSYVNVQSTSIDPEYVVSPGMRSFSQAAIEDGWEYGDTIGLLLWKDENNYQVVSGLLVDVAGQLWIGEEIVEGTFESNSLIYVSAVMTTATIEKMLTTPIVVGLGDTYGNTYTIQKEFCGKIGLIGSLTTVPITFATDLPVGFQCTLIRDAWANFEFTAPNGTTINDEAVLDIGNEFQSVYLLKYSATNFLALY